MKDAGPLLFMCCKVQACPEMPANNIFGSHCIFIHTSVDKIGLGSCLLITGRTLPVCQSACQDMGIAPGLTLSWELSHISESHEPYSPGVF